MSLEDKEIKVSFVYNYEFSFSFDATKFLDIKDTLTKRSIPHYCDIDEHGINVYVYLSDFDTAIRVVNRVDEILCKGKRL